MDNLDYLVTNLKKAKNYGASGSGTSDWVLQRITAVILIFCTIWIVFFIKYSTANISNFIFYLQKPYNIVPLLILVISALYHGMLGIIMIIGDYIHNAFFRYFLIISVRVFCAITIISFTLALFYIYAKSL